MENEKHELLNFIEETEDEWVQSIQMMKSYEDEIKTLRETVEEFEKEWETYIETKRSAEAKIHEFSALEE